MGEPMGLTASDINFSEATPEQRQLAWELNGSAWAKPMPLDVYVAREAYLSQQQLCSDRGCQYWVLHLKGYPRQIIASCETTRKTVLISEEGVSREGRGYSIASVYTNPSYRRRGMAAFLLRRLQEHMDRDSDCSVLYSDVGKTYYAGLGWRVFPSNQVTLTLLPSPTPSPTSSSPTLASPNDGKQEQQQHPVFTHSQPGRVRSLELEELRELCEIDEFHVTARFDKILADGKRHVAFLPSYPQISWQLARSGFMGRKLFEKAPKHKGAVTDNGRSWIYWDHDWREKKLKVLRIVQVLFKTEEERIDDIKVLLESALAEANAWGLPKVLLWNPDEVMTRGCKAAGNAHPEDVKIVFDERADTSIPSLRWAGGKDTHNTVWEDNFYYCWC
ncbi:hypothetical protein B0H66DRAFT_67944 [Apodospora peruviana]|uniref:N-acetyltransferase domain-containing protein n=1 Tax=Apodospora peruviana TaxID=516989 RepID=A0AAE0ISN7_9PEZI|nr:hypothetical protein B0H66DRAFT_67944 [Apodospora peruviana]